MKLIELTADQEKVLSIQVNDKDLNVIINVLKVFEAKGVDQ